MNCVRLFVSCVLWELRRSSSLVHPVPNASRYSAFEGVLFVTDLLLGAIGFCV